MARMPSKRWMEIVDRVLWAEPVDRGTALTLLSRQHASVVRLVKMRTITDVEGDWDKGYNMAIKDILAALQQGGEK